MITNINTTADGATRDAGVIMLMLIGPAMRDGLLEQRPTILKVSFGVKRTGSTTYRW
jgi:hypothetical protein